ncbi:SDR family oxidoreductase [Pyxidicoccus fallax]|uniref:SDR family oxidoreductase n=1 Tax=Pyxidicoccus fallax TaxID=394095 RepID=A0A848LLI2_9BACT|nr:SDR family oxidoreductase [Pyxidicoccus fallax]NPC83064.1 SDR family oxidoreductase [Pyxidicoccus fallax]
MIAYDFSNKVALVIGGTSGIGLATARGFARAGAAVVLAARGEDAGQKARAELEAQGARVLFVSTDVADESSVKHAVDATVKHFGRLDFAVNSSGAGGDLAPLEQANQDVWDNVMTINARGVWLAMRHEIPAMLASGGGAIVNVSSIYGLAGRPAHHAYVASKHAVVGLTRSVALEYATRGIRVNALCAGVTRTPAMRQAEAYVPDVVQALVNEHPMKRMATEEEVAGAALWLCSDAAGFVTGTPLAVDGGFLAA